MALQATVSGGPKPVSSLTPLRLAEVEKKTVSPKSEQLSKDAESEQKQQETRLPAETEQCPLPLIVQLGLFRAETDR